MKQLRTRWEEDPETAQSHHRKFSILPLALGLAVPVAFIAGAAITSFMNMPQSSAEEALAQSGGGLDGQLWTVDEQKRCAATVETARADIVSLRQQLETLQSQVISVTREKVEAEQKMASALAEKAATEAGAARVMTVSASAATDAPVDAVSPLVPVLQPDPSSAPSGNGSGSAPPPGSVQPISDVSVPDASKPAPSAEVMAAVTDQAPDLSASTSGALSPRSSLAVSDAMSSAAGLDVLSAPQRRDLEASLVRGECVSDSLFEAFNSRVPVVPLRDLIRKLDSEC
ncbi:hypothetical protein J2045_004094 [Peteryoungia aggregata LMG 23059]|uniref:Uncharacterized protein n=1 Tax=Peteryoungia aggregata LMG 23059 TaxID=1368425 RepID=A0ABU0GCH2_9HYPH|nr:hypothetical protein [Peteryoungia aggregata]MDQ0423044.1 hypothetical protein [Peteryoungia aggregata LMG 23059]